MNTTSKQQERRLFIIMGLLIQLLVIVIWAVVSIAGLIIDDISFVVLRDVMLIVFCCEVVAYVATKAIIRWIEKQDLK